MSGLLGGGVSCSVSALVMEGISLLTCSYKVTVKGVSKQMLSDRLCSSHQSLSNYLTPKETLTARYPVMLASG